MPPSHSLDEVFGLTTPRDFLAKAGREIERLRFFPLAIRGGIEPRLEVADHAINAAVSLWHVTDWLARYNDPRSEALLAHAKKVTGTPKSNRYEVLSEFVQKDAAISLCRDVCNGSKHLEFSHPQPVVSGTVNIKMTEERPLPMAAVMSASGSAEGRWIAKIVLEDGSRVPALEVYERALAYWQSLFAQFKL